MGEVFVFAPKKPCLSKHVKGMLSLGQSEFPILMCKLNFKKVFGSPQVIDVEVLVL